MACYSISGGGEWTPSPGCKVDDFEGVGVDQSPSSPKRGLEIVFRFVLILAKWRSSDRGPAKQAGVGSRTSLD